jgi:hypothetical protein
MFFIARSRPAKAYAYGQAVSTNGAGLMAKNCIANADILEGKLAGAEGFED